LISALVGGEWLASRSGHFTPGEIAPGTHWIGGWVGPRTALVGGEGQLHVPSAFPRYPLDRRLGGPQSRSGRRGQEKILDHAGTPSLIPQSSSQ
jgi:hypothetical protein